MVQLVHRSTLGMLAAALAAALSPAPAIANASSAAADIQAPLRVAEATRSTAPASGDEQFRSLFASWQSLDRGSAAAPMSAVSIPSRVPIDGYRLTSGYGMRNHPVTGGRRAHSGLDMACATGTPIYAAADGVVGKADWFGAYGLYVQLDHGSHMETRYGHMSRIAVASGQRVRKGDVIGYVGSTGRSTGPHLHYEVRIAGQAVDPIPYLQSSGREQSFAALTHVAHGHGGPE